MAPTWVLLEFAAQNLVSLTYEVGCPPVARGILIYQMGVKLLRLNMEITEMWK